MKIRYVIITLLISSLFCPGIVRAYNPDTTHWLNLKPTPYKKFYFGNNFDAALLQSSKFSRPGRSGSATPIRFTYFFNFGYDVHYDLNSEIGLFSGLGIKNMGFIDKYKNGDSTVKRRVYALGIPLGIKIGDIQDKKFLMLGGGLDFAFNYKEKAFVSRGHKQKFNEWLSDRTPMFLPYVFAGASFKKGITLKLQYYPVNFINSSYSFDNGYGKIYPYAGFNTKLFMLSLGFDMKYKKWTMKVKDKKKVIKNMM